MIGMIGKKLGMTRSFQEDGSSVPVTVIEVGPCVVTQVKSHKSDGYDAIQLGFGAKKAKNTPLPMQGHFRQARTTPLSVVREVRLDAPAVQRNAVRTHVEPAWQRDLDRSGQCQDTGVATRNRCRGGSRSNHRKRLGRQSVHSGRPDCR